MEIWRDIQGFEGIYQISNLGRVKNIKTNRIRKQGYDKDHYPKVELCNKKKYSKDKSIKIHRLVAENFIPNPHNLPEVNHIDGNKLNNSVSNLEWCSSKYNSRHRIYCLKKNSHWACKRIKCVELNKEFDSIAEGARYIGVTQPTLSEVLSKPNRTCRKYHWIYLD